MTVKYKVIRMAQPGVTGGGSYQYYPRVHQRSKIKLKELSQIISRRCALHSADILATLTALVEEIPELLLDNYSVELGELGIFSLHIKGLPSSTPEQVTKTNITEVKMAFRPSPLIKDKLLLAQFSKQQ